VTLYEEVRKIKSNRRESIIYSNVTGRRVATVSRRSFR